MIDYSNADVMPEKFVVMSHPDLAGTAETSKEAFEEVWAEKGWVLVTDAAPEVPTVVPVNGEQAAAMGVDLPAEVVSEVTADLSDTKSDKK